MIDVAQWIVLGLLAVAVLLLMSLVGKHDRMMRTLARSLTDTVDMTIRLAKHDMVRMLREPLVYCPRHGGQEQRDGVCVECRRSA